MKRFLLIAVFISAALLFNTCALEIANVIGPDGGYVFYDKGSYNYGWRYIQCSPYDFGEAQIPSNETKLIEDALKICKDNNANWHKFGWELPTEANMRKMLECFSYGLTKFSSDYYYITVNNLYSAPSWWICPDDSTKNYGNFCSKCGEDESSSGWVIDNDAPPSSDHLADSADWKLVILHKNFNEKANGTVEAVEISELPQGAILRIRAIRRF